MNATGKRRLLKLADFLDKLPASKSFEMNFFAHEIKDGRPACGTGACAAGWAASIPSFRRAGYRLTRSRHGDIRPAFEGKIAFEALERFFSISRCDALELFDWLNRRTGQTNPNSAEAAAGRIRDLVKRAA